MTPDNPYQRIGEIDALLAQPSLESFATALRRIDEYRQRYPDSTYDFGVPYEEVLEQHGAEMPDELLWQVTDRLFAEHRDEGPELVGVAHLALERGPEAQRQFVTRLLSAHRAREDGHLPASDDGLRRVIEEVLPGYEQSLLVEVVRWADEAGFPRDYFGLVQPLLEQRPARELEEALVSCLLRARGAECEGYFLACARSERVSPAVRASLAAAGSGEAPSRGQGR